MNINNFCNDDFISSSGCCGYNCNCSRHRCHNFNSVGPTGPEGSQGPQGPRGTTGATGQTGPQGLAATVHVETASSVPFDDNPSVINVGTPQEAIFKFFIPAGKPGDTGEQGPAGATGPQGDRGPTGARGATGPAGVKAFGQLNSIIANADLIKNTPTQVPLAYGGESENVNLAANTITTNVSGYYIIFYEMHPFLILTEDYADLTFTIRSNGVNISQTARTIRSTKGTHDLKFYGYTIAWLPAEAVVDSAFTCNEDGKFFFSLENISSLIMIKIA